MAVPDFQSLMLPVLRAVSTGTVTGSELREEVASRLGLTTEDLAERLPSGRQTTFANRIAWANVFLQRAGLIERVKRGVYGLSEAGRRVLAEPPDRIDMHYLERFPSYLEWRKKESANGPEISGSPKQVAAGRSRTPEEEIEAHHAAMTAALEADLLDRIREMPPAFFEGLIIDLLIAMGYGGGRAEMGKAVGRGGDSGIDGVVKEDVLGLDIVYMQAKRYGAGNNVGVQEVREFCGSLEGFGAIKGIFFATSSFSAGGREFVARIAKRIVLVDGPELARLMIRHDVGVRARAVYTLKTVDEDYFSQ